MSERTALTAATVGLSLLALALLAATTGATPVLLLACALAGMVLLARRLHRASRQQVYLADLLATAQSAQPRLRLVGTAAIPARSGHTR